MSDPSPRSFPVDYHDYVFKEGRFIGDFENMYRHAATVPWEQDKRCNEWYAQVGMLMLERQAPYESILEIGCGLGYIARKLSSLVGRGGVLHAFDISAAAVSRARVLHPCIDFYVDDIADAAFRPRRQYDLVVVRELLWYVVGRINAALENITACVGAGKLLYVGQSFPRLDGPFVGKDVIPSPPALTALLGAYEPVASAEVRNHWLPDDGPILHFVGKRRE